MKPQIKIKMFTFITLFFLFLFRSLHIQKLSIIKMQNYLILTLANYFDCFKCYYAVYRS